MVSGGPWTFHHPRKGTGEALVAWQRWRLLATCYHVAVFPVKPERRRAIRDSHTCQRIPNPSYRSCPNPRGNAYFYSWVGMWSQRLLDIRNWVVALPGRHTGPAREEPSFGSRVPIGNEVFSEVTAVYLGGEANGVTFSEIGTTRMSATNEALSGV